MTSIADDLRRATPADSYDERWWGAGRDLLLDAADTLDRLAADLARVTAERDALRAERDALRAELAALEPDAFEDDPDGYDEAFVVRDASSVDDPPQ